MLRFKEMILFYHMYYTRVEHFRPAYIIQFVGQHAKCSFKVPKRFIMPRRASTCTLHRLTLEATIGVPEEGLAPPQSYRTL